MREAKLLELARAGLSATVTCILAENQTQTRGVGKL